jgi:hypothetical protein
MCTSLNSTKYTALPLIPLLITFYICSWEATSHSQTSLYTVNHSSVWNSMTLKMLVVFHCSSTTIFITKFIYEMHTSIFLICKFEGFFTNTSHNEK